jgi:hypothetical protein
VDVDEINPCMSQVTATVPVNVCYQISGSENTPKSSRDPFLSTVTFFGGLGGVNLSRKT